MEHLKSFWRVSITKLQRVRRDVYDPGRESSRRTWHLPNTFCINECQTLGESESAHSKIRETSLEEKKQRDEEEVDDQIANEITNSDNVTFQSIFKKTMAGSMRKVIKDELQAWLGMKVQQSELQTNGHDPLEEQVEELEDLEAKECEEGGKGGEETPAKEKDGKDKDLMISPMRQIMNEEREAKAIRERRTSSRYASKRQHMNYELDTIARATKRKESMEDTCTLVQETALVTQQGSRPEGEGGMHVRRRL